MMRPFRDLYTGEFISRPNRFTVVCRMEGSKVRAFLPNPGRLWELLIPGTRVYMERADRKDRKLPYTVVAVMKDHTPVLLHTHRTNDIALFLIEKDLIPGLEGARVIRKEVPYRDKRFDLLVEKDGTQRYVEVKSCTLFSRHTAMFPDAPTLRGRRHIEELASVGGVVIFIISNPSVDYFLPEYHTDPEFAETLYRARNDIEIIPVTIRLNDAFHILPETKRLAIPWEIVERENRDRGAYILIIRLAGKRKLQIGGLGRITLRKGYYIYTGSALKGLSKRMERHRRTRKRVFWHIDYLREEGELRTIIPVRTEDRIECMMAERLRGMADWAVDGFGSSDCTCGTHLFGMEEDPMRSKGFINLIQYLRMERPLGFGYNKGGVF